MQRFLSWKQFAFARALAQDVDERTSWERYLRLEGEPTDDRTMRRMVAWIRKAFAAAARRERRPGTTRLMLIDPQRHGAAGAGSDTSAPAALPTLDDFSLDPGLKDFTLAEQMAAYIAAFPEARHGHRRARLIDR